MFRGYIHSNVPDRPFDMVFLDGPNYSDSMGSSTCMDAVKTRLESDKDLIYCVIDTRVSSVFMMQQIFGLNTLRYFPFNRTSALAMPRIKKCPNLSSESFSVSFLGKCSFNKTEFKE